VSLVEEFQARAAAHPRRTALIDGQGRSISYGALWDTSGRLAAALERRDVGRGDRVLMALWPGIELYAAMAAVWRRGAVVVFPEPAMGLTGLRHAARTTSPKVLLAQRKILALAALFPEMRHIPVWTTPGSTSSETTTTVAGSDDDPALISFTSGTTGVPKGIVRSHGLLMAQHRALTPLLKATQEGETDLVAFPAFVLTCLGQGTTAVLPRWNLKRHDRAKAEDVLRQIDEQRVTRALLPPVVVGALAGQTMPARLKRVITGGGPAYPDVMRRLLASAPTLGLTVVYGSTEAEPISHLDMETALPGLWPRILAGDGLPVGTPGEETSVRIIDGEILVAGAHVNPGYLDPRQDAETKLHDGGRIWHRTGDAGRLDEDGRLWLHGRVGSLTQGLFPFSVETSARLWPGVSSAALAEQEGRAILFIAGDLQNAPEWRRQAAALSGVELALVDEIPMDRRHRSKPDTKLLLARGPAALNKD